MYIKYAIAQTLTDAHAHKVADCAVWFRDVQSEV